MRESCLKLSHRTIVHSGPAQRSVKAGLVVFFSDALEPSQIVDVNPNRYALFRGLPVFEMSASKVFRRQFGNVRGVNLFVGNGVSLPLSDKFL